MMAMKKTQSDISDTLSNTQSLLSSGKSETSTSSRLMELMTWLNKYRLSTVNGSINTISEERKKAFLEVYNKEIMKITEGMIQLRAKK